MQDQWYVLDYEFLQELAQSAIVHSPPNDTAAMVNHILANLTETYPQDLSPPSLRLNTDVSEWVFNNAGGAMGSMYIIHASITEVRTLPFSDLSQSCTERDMSI